MNDSMSGWKLSIVATGSRANHFNLRSPRLDGNTRHINGSNWSPKAIICLTWLMWDLGSDFPSYNLNLDRVDLSGGSISSMSLKNGVWYLEIGSLGTGLVVRIYSPLPPHLNCWVITQITFTVSLSVKGFAEIRTRGDSVRWYSSFARCNWFANALAVQANTGSILHSILTFPRWEVRSFGFVLGWSFFCRSGWLH